MQSQVALLLQDAFLQAERFSIQGIGSFSQSHQPETSSIDIHFSNEDAQYTPLADIWQQEYDLTTTEVAQRISELRVAIRWAIKTNGDFLIPSVGSLRTTAAGELRFTPLQAPQEKPKATVPPPLPVATPVGKEDIPERAPIQQWVGYGLIALFALLGFWMIGKALIGPNEAQAANDPQAQLQAAAQLPARSEEAPHLDKAANLHTAAVDSPMKPVSTNDIVSPSRPQAQAPITQPSHNSPTTRITARDAQPMVSRGGTDNPNAVDINVLDTGQQAPPASTFSRMRGADSPTVDAQARDQYHLIAGSFANYEAANAFVRELREQGSVGTILPASQQSLMQYRVSIFHHEDRAQVASHKQALIDAGKKSGWIYAPSAN